MADLGTLKGIIDQLPRIRTKIQLTGAIVVVAAVLILHLYAPGNLPAMLCAGLIGISIIIFGQLFHFLRDFPERHRALVFLAAFALLCVVIAILCVFTARYIHESLSAAVTPVIDPPLVLPLPSRSNEANEGTRETVRIDPSAETTLSTGQLPESLLPMGDSGVMGLMDIAAKDGTILRYEYTHGDHSIRITPLLSYLNTLRNGGPVYPIWTDKFFFPAPVLSIDVNNPSQDPVYFSELVFRVHKRDIVPQEFPVISDVEYAEPKEFLSAGVLVIQNEGWARISDLSLQYQIVPMPEAMLSDFGRSVGGPQSLAALGTIEGVNWSAHLPFSTSALSKFSGDQYFEAQLAPAALNQFPNIRIGILFGVLSYRVEGAGLKKLRIVCRIFYYSRPGAGTVKPHYLYNVKLDPIGPSGDVSFPISESVAARTQESFLVSVFTEKPALISFDVLLRKTSGEVLQAGSVQMETFYPSPVANGLGEATRPSGSIIAATKVRRRLKR